MTMPNQELADARPLWRAPVSFLIHALLGSLIFIIIACPAIGLSLAVKWVENQKLGAEIVWGLKLGEYALFGTDLLLFLVFLWKAAKRAVREL